MKFPCLQCHLQHEIAAPLYVVSSDLELSKEYSTNSYKSVWQVHSQSDVLYLLSSTQMSSLDFLLLSSTM